MKNKILKLIIGGFLAGFMVLGFFHPTLAQTDLGLNTGAQIGLSGASPMTIIVNVVRVLLGFLALVAVIIIMYGGWMYMTSEGNPEKVDQAKKLMRNAAIGLVIILSAFGIVSFLINKFGPGGGTPGAHCDPPCSGGTVCCPGNFCATDCGSPNPSDAFLISNTVPANNETNVVRNVTIRVFFNNQYDPRTDFNQLKSRFTVQDIGSALAYDNSKIEFPKLIAMEALAQSANIAGTVASSTDSNWHEIDFLANATCKDIRGNDIAHCLDGFRKFRVTLDPNAILAVDGRRLTCSSSRPCTFTFSTGNLIDTTPPTAGMYPAQICRDDGTLKADANTVGGWGRDDIRMARLAFTSRRVANNGSPLGQEIHSDPDALAASGDYIFADHKYDTRAMNIKDYYAFTVYAHDSDSNIASSTFITDIKPGHCCNGVKDADEDNIDCGGADCLACEGQECNRNGLKQCVDAGNKSNCGDELCASGFCQCSTNNCLCKNRPIIYSISPAGGFCDGDVNKPCSKDGDCAGLNPSTCNKDIPRGQGTPNGAPLNLVTIYGRNFGNVSKLWQNVLTNVNFETLSSNGFPADWAAGTYNTPLVKASVVTTQTSPANHSVLIHQDPNVAYPEVCSYELCMGTGDPFPFSTGTAPKYKYYPYASNKTPNFKDQSGNPLKDQSGKNIIGCQWVAAANGKHQCVFPHDVNCGAGKDVVGKGDCVVNEGEPLKYPYTNRVNWYNLTYNISSLKFEVGDRYILRFKYKGHAATTAAVRISKAFNWSTQAWVRREDSNCVQYGGDYCAKNPGRCVCSEDPNSCCMNAPYQTKPYRTFDFPPLTLKPGENDWTTYEAYFTYTPEMDKLRDANNNIVRYIGLEAQLANTGPGGTDIYIDDFQFAKVSSPAIVTFLGAAEADRRDGRFPSDINPNCVSTWTDNQIIMTVPENVVSGPIQILADNGLSDRTDDEYGPPVKNFVANTIVRPGICRINNNKCSGQGSGCLPDHGLQNDTLEYFGLNLKANTGGYFGDWWGNMLAGLDPNFGLENNLSGTAKVPNLVDGLTDTFAVYNNINSNYVLFFKDAEPYLGPKIMSFEPQSGPIGQYITIRGRGFGKTRGSNKVYFGSSSGREASYDFPKICADSVWSDNQVIIKVPAGISEGNYLLTMKLGANTIDTADLPAPNFSVNHNPLKPSLCRIQPTMGLVGDNLKLWGEYFGDKNDRSKIRFFLNKDQFGAAISWGLDSSVTGSNEIIPYLATTAVPTGAVTGPVRIVKDGEACPQDGNCGTGRTCVSGRCQGELVGNGLNFSVGSCSTDSQCGEDAVCCPANSPAKGRCLAKTTTKTDAKSLCFDAFNSSVHEWDFSTTKRGEGDDCDKNRDLPGCQKDNCDTGLICGDDCKCHRPCNSAAGETCQPDNNKCTSPDYPVCDKNDCLCKGNGPESCSGYDVNICYNSYFCPNSPGNCSANQGGHSAQAGTCDYGCKSITECKTGNCAYDSTTNRCILSGNNSCSANKTVSITFNNVQKYYTAVCAKPIGETVGRWVINTMQSCPDGWTRTLGSQCIQDDEICDLCATGFKCLGEGAAAKCGIDKDICLPGSVCNSDNVCVKNDVASCQCCCAKSQNTTKGNPACCAPLKCGNTCGASVGQPDKVCKRNNQESDITCESNSSCTAGWSCQSGECQLAGHDYSQFTGVCSTAADCAANWTCGSNSKADFGLCTGCANVGTTQDQHDAACNCTGTTGKYCDTSVKGGVCRDCTELTTLGAAQCSEHPSSCCVNAKDGNKCSGKAGTKGIGPNSDWAYCAYYNCERNADSGDMQCAADNPVVNGDYDRSDCNGKCGLPPDKSCYSNKDQACTLNCSESTLCLGSTGCFDYDHIPPTPYVYRDDQRCPKGQDTTGCACCCDPFKQGSDSKLPNYDSCQKLGTENKLHCVANKGEKCTGANRGLCCGCAKDVQCVPQPNSSIPRIPELTGCGFDACCYPRPNVATTTPAIGATSICRNPEISAGFDTKMNVSSFESNMIVVGQYLKSKGCPASSTVLLTLDMDSQGRPKGLWQRLVMSVKNLFSRFFYDNNQPAIADVDAAGNQVVYCAVKGMIGGYHNAAGRTQATFNPIYLLDPLTKYYVIVKGDSDLLKDDTREGVLSLYGVGMNGPGFVQISGGNRIEQNPKTFNGVKFTNAYIWSFTTKDASGPNKGICPVDHVLIDPQKYLYQTNVNDGKENDLSLSNSTFDTVADSDKLFRSNAFSKDNQPLSPVVGYSWDWDWGIVNNLVVATSTREINNSTYNGKAFYHTQYELVAAKENIQYKETQVTATVRLTDISQETGGDGKTNYADVYVFICQNPWPLKQDNGTWEPVKDWLRCLADGTGKDLGSCPSTAAAGGTCYGFDKDSRIISGHCRDNCTVTEAGQSCRYTNQEIFYCRDKGNGNNGSSTIENLLPYMNNGAIIGNSSLRNILKEFYYSR